jgi:hypothetical protein
MTPSPVPHLAEVELRRCLRAASVLLGQAERSQVGRTFALRRAEHLLRLVLDAVHQHLALGGVPEPVDDDKSTEPLTSTGVARTIGGRS